MRLRELLRKSFWPLLDKVVRMALALLVGVVVARYLGPERLGLLSFALAWASFFGGFAWLGLGEAVTRDIVRAPDQQHTLLGSVVTLRLAGCVVAAVLALLLLPVFFPEASGDLWLMVAIIVAASFFSETAGAVTIWILASGNTRYLALTRTLPFVLAQGARLVLVAFAAAVPWFAAAVPLEAALSFAAAWWVYARVHRRLPVPGVDRRRAKRLLAEALPVLLAALLASLALRLDQMMLAALSDFHQVGLYAGAIRLSEVWWGIAPAVMQVAAPMLLYANDDAASRQRYLELLYGGLLVLALAAAAVVTLCARPLVHLLLGPDFDGAAPVLVVHVWTAAFVFMEALTYQELIRRRLQKVLMIRAALAIGINAALNLWLIPAHGAMGAAVATLLSFALAPALALAAFPSTRDLLSLQFQGVPALARELARRRFPGRPGR